ncbi:osmoprotectant transport system permease protein [Kineococcus xinjiangensis]|uniref:Osmoprotectant transport system permease protein n=1 Tax=Kineococcus xinjiangensis TaxID=512762 RepID=A0A2S6IGU6_9ACTN|nr:ABC transporter permease subunit [Kineococcus xinjiangensis]PPK93438.1 osmoprotectant transport system permease protein [Kineococcus xinjiangensis]
MSASQGWVGLVGDYLLDPRSWTEPGGLGERLVEHVWLSGLSVALAVLLTVPVALLLGHAGRGGGLAVVLGNLGRAVPVLALIALLFLLPAPLGPRDASVVVALTLFAVPPLLTNTYVGVRQVDRGVVEAARGMGMSAAQVLLRVELPLALPLVLTGLRLAALQTVATASVAGMVAGPGLGRIVTEGFTTDAPSRYVGAALVIAALALAVEGLLVLLQRAADRVGRARRRGPGGGAADDGEDLQDAGVASLGFTTS